MARPSADTEKGKLATIKWRKTMEEKYGGVSEHARKIGAIGGRKSKGGGFSDREFASKMGSLGGLISKRGHSYETQWKEYGPKILAMYDSGEYSIAEIARKFEMPYGVVRFRIKREKNKNEN